MDNGAIFIEIGNALGSRDRIAAIDFIRNFYREPNCRVVALTTELLLRAIDLYSSRPDKQWGLTDCISFIVMQEKGLTDALTADHHFAQAGFRPLLA